MTNLKGQYPQLIFLVGPTAVGKSEVGYRWAKRINAEIISCDSMQVYKEICVASSKPTQQMMKEIKHHLIDVVSLKDKFDVAQFNQLALKAIEEIQKRKYLPMIVGGSGLYMAILLDGIFSSEINTEAIRIELQEKAQSRGVAYLYALLEKEDPSAAKKIHPNDTRRIIRALEICRAQGQPISALQKQRSGLWDKMNIRILGLTQDRAKLYAKINQRVEKMFEEGLVDEIRTIAKQPMSLTAQGLIGIKEILGFLRGEYDEKEAKELLKLNTRHLAKRQMTWFRKDKRIEWVNIDEYANVEALVDHLDSLVQQPKGGKIGNS